MTYKKLDKNFVIKNNNIGGFIFLIENRFLFIAVYNFYYESHSYKVKKQ